MAHGIGKHEDIGLALTRLALDDLSAARADLADDRPSARGAYRARLRHAPERR